MTSTLKGLETAFSSYFATGAIAKTHEKKEVSPPVAWSKVYQKSQQQAEKTQSAQLQILNFFRDLTREVSLSEYLKTFDHVFVNHARNQIPFEIQDAVHQLLRHDNAQVFGATLNDVCYVFINHCFKSKEANRIGELLELISTEVRCSSLSSTAKRRVQRWLSEFRSSQEYQALMLFSPQQHTSTQWSDRYRALTVYAQRSKSETFDDQYEAKQTLYRYLHSRYKFRLTMFLTKGDRVIGDAKPAKNPTSLPEITLKMMHRFLGKQHQQLAQNSQDFLNESLGKDYRTFKTDLVHYLCLNVNGDRPVQWLSQKLTDYLMELHCAKDDIKVGPHLLKKTCNAVIRYLLNPKNLKDSEHPFTLLMLQNEFLSLSLLLLKLLLISPCSYSPLMLALNSLLVEFADKPKESCPWLIHFLETIRVIITIGLHQGQWTAGRQKQSTIKPV